MSEICQHNIESMTISVPFILIFHRLNLPGEIKSDSEQAKYVADESEFR